MNLSFNIKKEHVKQQSLTNFPDETEKKRYPQLFCTMWGITADNVFFSVSSLGVMRHYFKCM